MVIIALIFNLRIVAKFVLKAFSISWLFFYICAIFAVPIASVAQDAPPNQAANTEKHDDNGQSDKNASTNPFKCEQGVPHQPKAPKKECCCEQVDDAKTDWWARITNGFIEPGSFINCAHSTEIAQQIAANSQGGSLLDLNKIKPLFLRGRLLYVDRNGTRRPKTFSHRRNFGSLHFIREKDPD